MSTERVLSAAGQPADVPGAGGGAARRRRRGSVSAYDFRHPTKLSRDHARGLQIVYETFARQWATQMTASLRFGRGLSAQGLR